MNSNGEETFLPYGFPIRILLSDYKAGLETIFTNNPALRNVFTDGFISSGLLGYTSTGGRRKNVNVFRTNMEESGLLTGLFAINFLIAISTGISK